MDLIINIIKIAIGIKIGLIVLEALAFVGASVISNSYKYRE